jgi:hypothetical protein
MKSNPYVNVSFHDSGAMVRQLTVGREDRHAFGVPWDDGRRPGGPERQEDSMRRVLIVSLSATALAAGAAPIASAGQPNANCDDVPVAVQPPGFQTGGFAHAESVYAGSEGTASAQHANSPNAVSQYDIACIQRAAAHS